LKRGCLKSCAGYVKIYDKIYVHSYIYRKQEKRRKLAVTKRGREKEEDEEEETIYVHIHTRMISDLTEEDNEPLLHRQKI
jgi:uncharacterized OsmC-like protein